MELVKNIVFLGMMGSGKSSIGLLLSKKLKRKFFDVDICIEKELGMKIPIIFEKKGEKFFRDFEEKITLKILRKRNIVIAIGGGAFLSKNVRNEILANHISFWLQWNSQTLVERIANNPKRPYSF